MITNFQTASICNVTVVKIIQSTKQKFLYHKNVNLVFPIMINAANNKCSDVSIFKGKARKVDYMSSCKLRENICFYMTGNKDGRRGAKPKKHPALLLTSPPPHRIHFAAARQPSFAGTGTILDFRDSPPPGCTDELAQKLAGLTPRLFSICKRDHLKKRRNAVEHFV